MAEAKQREKNESRSETVALGISGERKGEVMKLGPAEPIMMANVKICMIQAYLWLGVSWKTLNQGSGGQKYLWIGFLVT